MPHTFFDHTGDVGVWLRASTLPDLFREAARAFTETLTEPEKVRASTREEINLEAPTLDDLLVEWLNELLYRFEVRHLLPVDAALTVDEIPDAWVLRGEVSSDTFDPERHPIHVAIKGITYHQLDVRHSDEGWATAVVFDI